MYVQYVKSLKIYLMLMFLSKRRPSLLLDIQKISEFIDQCRYMTVRNKNTPHNVIKRQSYTLKIHFILFILLA